MTNERVATARRQYLNLGIGEWFAVAVFFGVARFSIMPRLDTARDAYALWAALIPLLAILFQGGAYWLLARTWVGRSVMPGSLALLFRVLRVLNVVLLLGGLAGILIWFPTITAWGIVVLLVWAFGVFEYLNYFVVRLSYPFTQWFAEVGRWRKPRLQRDLERAARTPR